ncbi:uncharacterized protein [Amphiura filiformis]|uniref:uncharacterized protein n=1 Tax=Amphiura filiformis TaxID=82378 RepID=UPI003B20EC7A
MMGLEEQVRLRIGPRYLFLSVVLAAFCCCYVGAQRHERWYCTPVFSMLQSMCGSCYAGIDKRSDNVDRTPQQSLDAFIQKEVAYSFIKRTSSGNSFLRDSRSQHRGLIDECCTSQCEAGEMILYCCQERQREWHSVRGFFNK